MKQQRNEQAGRVTEGGHDAGRGVQHGDGPDDAAVADADPEQTMDAGPEAGIVDDAGTGAGPDDDVLLVGSALDDEDRTEADARPGVESARAPGMANDAIPADRPGGQQVPGMQMAPGSPDLSQRWHEIQATFVDDPRGSVELAAAEAREAVASFVAAISQRQESLLSASGRAASDGSTEQLRSALQDYRTFCQTIEDLVGRLAQPVAGSAR